MRADRSSAEPILLTEASLEYVIDAFLPEGPDVTAAARPRTRNAEPIVELFDSETPEDEPVVPAIRATAEAERPWRTYARETEIETAGADEALPTPVTTTLARRPIRMWTNAAGVVIGLAAIGSIAILQRLNSTPAILVAGSWPAASALPSPPLAVRATDAAVARPVANVIAGRAADSRERRGKAIVAPLAGKVLKGSLTPDRSRGPVVEPRTTMPSAVVPATRPTETPPMPDASMPAVSSPREPAPEPPRAPPVQATHTPSAASPVPDAAPPAREPLPAPSSSAPTAVATLAGDTASIEAVLSRYRHAFTALDANAARAVWPSVDARALGRAFDQLVQQQLEFQNCSIVVNNARATAACGGRARYVPRVGSRSVHDEPRQWTFSLEKANGQWVIERVASR